MSALYLMSPDGLDKWVNTAQNQNDSKFLKSCFPNEHITLFSLKERILELENMRGQILYELDRLKSLTENKMHNG
jgi:hypothetical protein